MIPMLETAILRFQRVSSNLGQQEQAGRARKTSTPEIMPKRFEKNWAVLHFEGSSEFFLFRDKKG
jgi:hypothetical protein